MSTSLSSSPQYERLALQLEALGSLVVAFSGGVDSSLLGYVATKVLGSERVLCATAVSPSLPGQERDECVRLATRWSLRHVLIETHELDDPAYLRNDLDRCFHCKQALMSALLPIANEENAKVALGVVTDDLGEHRPGQDAALAGGAVFPFVAAGLSKSDIRSLSGELGLETADKPASACLASRIPHGVPVSFRVLGQVERAEMGLRQLGFSQLRVRHGTDTCRIELSEDELQRAVLARAEIVAVCKNAGYRFVTLDLEGYRSGSLVAAALERRTTREPRR